MKYAMLLSLAVLITHPVFAAAAENNSRDLVLSSAPDAGMKACPRKGADAMIAIERQLGKGNDHIATLCLMEYVKYLEGKVRALETRQAK